ncbi:MAG: selenocysteine-specific translation elongation factor [Acetobacteraceae bacterium]
MALILGVIGHVDHGKTALVRALTGIETDRLAEERRRGISIALGFAHLAAPGAVVDLIDMPGHERFIRTMVSGATGIGGVLLVVAANEGIRPQTIEHAEIVALLGVREAIVAVSKCDLVPVDRAEAVGAEAAALAIGLGLRASAPFLVSARDGQGIAGLADAIAALAARAPPPVDRGVCYLPIDRAFSIAGHGTVVTGTLRGGAIAAGDEVELTHGGRRVRVRGVQVRGASVPSAAPAQRVAVNLRGIEPAEARRGLALAAPGLLAASSWLTVELRAAPSARPVASAARLRMLFGTSEAGATLRLLDRAELAAGETCLAQLRCVPRVAVPVGEGVILRLVSEPRIVAGGRVLDPCAQRLRRDDPTVLAWGTVLASETPQAIVTAALIRADAHGAELLGLARLAGLSVARTEAALRRTSVLIAGETAVAVQALERTEAAILRALDSRWSDQPEGVAREQLRAAMPECGAAVLDLALTRLAAQGRIERAGRIRLLRVELEAARRVAGDALATALAENFRQAGLSPSTAAPADVATRRALDRLVREGVLVRAPDRVQKREILFHRDAIEEARRRLRPLLVGDAGLLVGDIGAAFGISRKYSVPLLEYLDATHFTRRVGDRRVIRDDPLSP